MRPRILVTGGTGFIGRELVPVLCERGADVHLLGRSPSADPRTVSHRCDLLRGAEIESILSSIRPTHLIHLAWYAIPGKFWSAPENLDWVAASLNLVRAFARAGGQRLCVGGSCAEYQWGDAVLSETSPLRPSTLYGQSKASLYRLLEAASGPLGLSSAWARIFFPFGPLESPERLFGALLQGMRDQQPIPVSAGTQQRDFIHVEDAAAAIAAIALGPVEGPVNVGSGRGHSVRHFCEIAAATGGGTDLVRFGERPLQDGEPQHLVADVGRLTDEVGFSPRFTLESGIADAIASYNNAQPIKDGQAL